MFEQIKEQGRWVNKELVLQTLQCAAESETVLLDVQQLGADELSLAHAQAAVLLASRPTSLTECMSKIDLQNAQHCTCKFIHTMACRCARRANTQ